MDNTPIVIFGYNRPSHFERTLNSIFNNKEASDTEAFIFIDGVSNETDELNNQKVISIASRELKFRKTTVHIREENIGCKRNIIDGVSEVFSVHKQAIIIEDDLILGKNFLNYMNNALSFYKQKEDIWHVNGYCHPQIIHNKKTSPAITTFSIPASSRINRPPSLFNPLKLPNIFFSPILTLIGSPIL